MVMDHGVLEAASRFDLEKACFVVAEHKHWRSKEVSQVVRTSVTRQRAET